MDGPPGNLAQAQTPNGSGPAQRSPMSAPLRFTCAVPIGSWHPLLPGTLASLARQEADLAVAALDASGDPRVARALDASGIEFTYRREGPDDGQAAAIAEGWRAAPGEILFWLNADDRLEPRALTQVAAAFEQHHDADVVYGGSGFINAEGRPTGRHTQVADVSDLLLRSNTISQPSCFARRAAVERVGGLDERLHYVMDWDLWVRLYRNGARFLRIEPVLSQVYMGRGTKTARLNPRRLSEIALMVRRNAGTWSSIKSTVAVSLETLQRGRSS